MQKTHPSPGTSRQLQATISTSISTKALQNSAASASVSTLHYHEFLCGWTVGCMETCLFYPIGRLIMRQQLHNVAMMQAVEQLKREGIRHLYRGLLPPLIQATTNKSIMFGTFETYQAWLGCPTGHSAPSFRRALAAFLAGTTEATMCPLERVQILLQNSQHLDRFKNTGHAFRVLLTQFPLKELYRGYTVVLLRNSCSDVVFFSLRTPLRESVLHRFHHFDPKGRGRTGLLMMANFISGALLGATISSIFYPLNVVKTRMQAQLGGNFQSALQVLRTIMAERHGSIREVFCGLKLSLALSVIGWGFGNSFYELLLHQVFGVDATRE